MQPLAFDGYCGLGGWAEGFLAEGWRVVGFDIERHEYGSQKYPAQLVLQDMKTLHGFQLRDANCLVFSPPCQEFSYMAMPFSRGKQIAAALRGDGAFPEGYTGSRTIAQLTALFDACFRIQREACEAAGRYIPMVVENVKGAQPWVGRAKANFGSFYLWGDVAMVGNRVVCGAEFGRYAKPMRAQAFKAPGQGSGAAWFDVRFDAVSIEGQKITGYSAPRRNGGKGVHLTSQRENDGGSKSTGGTWFGPYEDRARNSCHTASGSSARKSASAQIAKIPFALSTYVARSYKPRLEATA